MSFLGVDIGTGSSKAVLVNGAGEVLASATRPHETSSPHPGWFEHDAEADWWGDFMALVGEILRQAPAERIEALCTSGIGPCALVTDEQGTPLRAAILYGIDRRATREIDELTRELGEDEVLARTGNLLSTQAVGPKLRWLARHEPEVAARARRWYCASSFLLQRLTGAYVIDHYSASTSDPLYDLARRDWWPEGWASCAGAVEPPRLVWPGDVVGAVTPAAAQITGLPAGLPVAAGTIDAMAEAYSAGCRDVGDTMVMYGSTLFLIQVVARPVVHRGFWAGSGRTAATFSVAAGMATSGLVSTWLAQVAGTEIGALMEEAGEAPPGSGGVVLLPYFAGERTPIMDPEARGVWLGLTLDTGRAHLSRSILEGVAFGVRHNLDAMTEAGASPVRLVAVGGGTRGGLWTQIVSDVTGLPQDLPTTTIGASYGDARMAADALGIDTAGWNPVARRISPNPQTGDLYGALYRIYRDAYPALAGAMHRLGRLADD